MKIVKESVSVVVASEYWCQGEDYFTYQVVAKTCQGKTLALRHKKFEDQLLSESMDSYGAVTKVWHFGEDAAKAVAAKVRAAGQINPEHWVEINP